MSLTKYLLEDIPFVAYRTEDPFAGFQIPFVEEYLIPHVSGFGNMKAHVHEVIGVALFYHVVYLIAVYTFPVIWPRKQISPQLLREYGIHVVSILQSVIILTLLVPALRYSDDPYERIFGYTPYGGMVAAFAMAYFVWDAVISLLYSGFGFFIHGLVSSIVFGIGLYPYIVYYAPIFLLFEASNPFLNLRWFGIKFPGSFSDRFQLLNNIILINVFFFARLFWGWYQVINLALDFYAVRDDPKFSLLFSLIILGCNLVLDILNVYWFYRMILVAARILKQMFTKKDKKLVDKKKK